MEDPDEVLKPVLRRLQDSIAGFRDVAHLTKNASHRSFALGEVEVRRRFAGEVRSLMKRPENEPLHGSSTGFFLRRWKDVRALLPHADVGVLRVAEQGEEVSKDTYSKALAKNPDSASVREVLQRQQAHVYHSQTRLRQLQGKSQA